MMHQIDEENLLYDQAGMMSQLGLTQVTEIDQHERKKEGIGLLEKFRQVYK